jgi:hypothetical protein
MMRSTFSQPADGHWRFSLACTGYLIAMKDGPFIGSRS